MPLGAVRSVAEVTIIRDVMGQTASMANSHSLFNYKDQEWYSLHCFHKLYLIKIDACAGCQQPTVTVVLRLFAETLSVAALA